MFFHESRDRQDKRVCGCRVTLSTNENIARTGDVGRTVRATKIIIEGWPDLGVKEEAAAIVGVASSSAN